MGWLAIAASIGWGLREWYHQKQRADNAEASLKEYQEQSVKNDRLDRHPIHYTSDLEKQLKLAEETAADCKMAYDHLAENQISNKEAYRQISGLEKKANSAIAAVADCKKAYDGVAQTLQRFTEGLMQLNEATTRLMADPEAEISYSNSSANLRTYLPECDSNADVTIYFDGRMPEAELYGPDQPRMLLSFTPTKTLTRIDYQGFEPQDNVSIDRLDSEECKRSAKMKMFYLSTSAQILRELE